jgi:hypothetical protein
LRYEALLGRQLSSDACVICLFDKKRIEELGISQITKSHGYIISEELYGKTVDYRLDTRIVI